MQQLPPSIPIHALKRLLDHQLQVNLHSEAADGLTVPVCIWGRHGIGKTQFVERYARDKGWAFVAVAPAQFEEMGDLLGMPAQQEDRMVFRQPDWVPDQEGPGILLLDDINRADDRILRGIMQLLQFRRLVSWRLPPKWQIVLTANPPAENYSVTPLDDAMLSRMMHVHLRFDVQDWVNWAKREGLPAAGITFIQKHPDALSGNLTTARTFHHFLVSIQSLRPFRENLALLTQLAMTLLDNATVELLIPFLRDYQQEEYSAYSFLHGEGGDALPTGLLRGESPQLMAFTEELLEIVREKRYINSSQQEQLRLFLCLPQLRVDQRLWLAQQLAALNKPSVSVVLADPAVTEALGS